MKLPRARRAAATMITMVALLPGRRAPATVRLAAARGAARSQSVQLTPPIRPRMLEAYLAGAIGCVWRG